MRDVLASTVQQQLTAVGDRGAPALLQPGTGAGIAVWGGLAGKAFAPLRPVDAARVPVVSSGTAL